LRFRRRFHPAGVLKHFLQKKREDIGEVKTKKRDPKDEGISFAIKKKGNMQERYSRKKGGREKRNGFAGPKAGTNHWVKNRANDKMQKENNSHNQETGEGPQKGTQEDEKASTQRGIKKIKKAI